MTNKTNETKFYFIANGKKTIDNDFNKLVNIIETNNITTKIYSIVKFLQVKIGKEVVSKGYNKEYLIMTFIEGEMLK